MFDVFVVTVMDVVIVFVVFDFVDVFVKFGLMGDQFYFRTKLFSLRARFTLIWFRVICQKPETDDELNSPLCPTCRTCLDLHGWGWMLVEVRWLELASPRNIGYCNLDLASSFSRTNNYEAVAQLVESLLFTLEVCTVRITSKTQLNFLPTQIVI